MPSVRLFVALAALLACGRDPAPAAPTVIEPPAAATVALPTATPVAVVDDGPIGVEPCDRYVDRYRRCIAEALPEEERPVHREVMEGQRVAWARARADDTLAASLPEACEAAQAAARVAVPHCKHFRSGGS